MEPGRKSDDLYRTGARVWIARIMVTWGLAASAMMLVRTPASFYLLRFLLGVAEAGFFPGIIYYLTHWYPARERPGPTPGSSRRSRSAG